MAAPKRPLQETDANAPAPQRVKTSESANDTYSPLSSASGRQIEDRVLPPTHVSVTTGDGRRPQRGTESTVTNTTTPLGDTDVQPFSSSDAQQTAPPQASEDHESVSENVESDQAVPPADANRNATELAIVHADTVHDEVRGNEVILASDAVEEVQALGPAELKLRRMREAMKSLPGHVFIVSFESTFHGDTSTNVGATETSFDSAFEVVLADAEAESYENYDTADEDSDNEFEDQGPEREDARLEWREAQGNRERLIRIARISTRGSITFDLVDDNGYDDNRLMITISRRPVGGRGNRQARLAV